MVYTIYFISIIKTENMIFLQPALLKDKSQNGIFNPLKHVSGSESRKFGPGRNKSLKPPLTIDIVD